MSKAKIHLINALPHIYELEDMMDFCKKYDHLYIYGKAENQEYLLKYFDMCGISIEGYVVTTVREEEEVCFLYRKMPVYAFESIYQNDSTGVILGLSDRHYGSLIPMFREKGFKNYFMMSEFNRHAIANQLRPRCRQDLAFEVSLADHCNLSCQMCDHYSQLSKEWFVDMNQFKSDMKRMGELFEHQVGGVYLLGGEPTLHEHLIDCLKITREQFPETEIIILTNGIKLLEWENSPKGNLWQACKDYNIHITVTVYPIRFDYAALEEKGKQYGVSVSMSSDIHAANNTMETKISDKHTMDLTGSIDKFYCVNCLYFNKFSVLKDGRLYMCPISAHINIFNECFGQSVKIKPNDYLDIYTIESWKEIAEFTSSYVPFCSYCDLKHWGHYSEWKPSTKKMEEYV